MYRAWISCVSVCVRGGVIYSHSTFGYRLFVSSLSSSSSQSSTSQTPSHLFLSSIVIFMLTPLLNMLTVCILPYYDPTVVGFVMKPIFMLSISLVCKTYPVSSFLFIGKFWNSLPLTVSPPMFDLNSFKKKSVYRRFSFQNWPLHWKILLFCRSSD